MIQLVRYPFTSSGKAKKTLPQSLHWRDTENLIFSVATRQFWILWTEDGNCLFIVYCPCTCLMTCILLSLGGFQDYLLITFTLILVASEGSAFIIFNQNSCSMAIMTCSASTTRAVPCFEACHGMNNYLFTPIRHSSGPF